MSNPIIYICVIQQRYDRLKFDESYNKYELAFYTLKVGSIYIRELKRF